MSYIRLSLMKPRHGQEDAVRALLDEMVMFHEAQPGYLTGYRVEHADDGSSRVGRLAIWDHPSDADRVAIRVHDMAMRARLNDLIEPSSHEELSLYGHWAPKDGSADAPRADTGTEDAPAFEAPLPA